MIKIKINKDENLLHEVKIDKIENNTIYLTISPRWSKSDLIEKIRKVIDAHFENKIKKDYFWRATNNPKEIEQIKKGEMAKSYNYADGYFEDGISVADHLGYVMIGGYKYGYRVRGKVISEGSDGEYVLDPKTMEFVDKKPRTINDIRKKEHKEYFKELQKAVEEEGLNFEDYRKQNYDWSEI
jgi:hypothetical protein